MDQLGRFLKHYVFPFGAVTLCPIATHLLANYPRDEGLSGFRVQMLFGNMLSWAVMIIWLVWNAVFVRVEFDRRIGPLAHTGQRPEYNDNAVPLAATNFLIVLGLNVQFPRAAEIMYENFPYFIGTLNIVAFSLCLLLWLKGKYFPSARDERAPTGTGFLFEFFAGLELHPEILRLDVKQWICRCGVSSWQQWALFFFVASYRKSGFDPGVIVLWILQNWYLKRYFEWEPGYLRSLDVVYERAGFALMWGYLCAVPALYCYNSYYFVNHLPKLSYLEGLVVLIVSLILIEIKSKIDNQKADFRSANPGEFKIDDRPAQYIEVEYDSGVEGPKKSLLLTSGYWGKARHLAYLYELGIAFSWAVIGFRCEDTLQPFLYLIFLAILLLHRIGRDEHKCEQKYGDGWRKYCRIVRYKLIPKIY